ncbi:MAG: hypothetical protein FJ123_01610 [Deltaproteobacteria bacterium]|nr:hypothetical protein [Deltaproteobacteria bacterium]
MEMVRNSYKETEIGKLPEEWEIVSLKNHLIIKGRIGWKGLMISEYINKGPYIIGGLQIINDSIDWENCAHITEERYAESPEIMLKEDDILMTKDGTIGKLAYLKDLPDRATVASHIHVIRRKTNKILPKFLFYFFKTPIFRALVESKISGSVVPALTQRDIETLNTPLPPIPEQTRIAEILSSIDDKIEVNHQMNKTLEKIGQALFKHWFVDFEFPNEEGKPYKSSGGKMIDSELGEIPEGWKVAKLADYGVFKNGINYLRDEIGDTEFFIVNVRDIANNRLLLKNSLDRINIDLKKAKDYLLNDKDILIARSASPGEVSLVLGNLDKVIYSGFSIRYRLNNPNSYLYMFLIMQGLKENLSNFAVGTTLQSVNQETLRNMRFLLPPDKTLNEFNKIIEQILEKTYNNLIQNSSLSQIRDSLLPRLMSGKIRVRTQ